MRAVYRVLSDYANSKTEIDQLIGLAITVEDPGVWFGKSCA